MSPTGCDHGSSEGKHGKLRQQNGVYLEDGPPVHRGLVTPQNYKPCSWRPFGRDPITPGLGDVLTGSPSSSRPTNSQSFGRLDRLGEKVGPAGKRTGKEGNRFQDSGVFFFFRFGGLSGSKASFFLSPAIFGC